MRTSLLENVLVWMSLKTKSVSMFGNITSYFTYCMFPAKLRIITGKKQAQIKLQLFRKVWLWTFRWLVHQINSLDEVLKLKQNFRKNKLVTGKTPSFVMGSSCSPHSIYPNTGFWQSRRKTILQFFEKGLRFSENLFQSWSIENVQNFQWLWQKNMPIPKTEGYFKNP